MSTAASLNGCVASLRTSMQLLESSINILEAGVHDLPRLSTVLQTTRHFELVTETDLIAAQSSLVAEIAPELTSLLSRISTHLDGLARREASLIAKAELQDGRLSQRPSRAPARTTAEGEALTGLQEVKAKQLRQKKERLSYAVSRLEMQAGQRERQLRKSMAFSGDL